MAAEEILRHGREAARLTRWHGEGSRLVFTPVMPVGLPLSTEFIAWCLEQPALRDKEAIFTPALSEAEAGPFLQCNFAVHEELCLLARSLGRDSTPLPDTPRHPRIVRARRRHLSAIVTLDNQSFPPFWIMDSQGLTDACHATPRHRFVAAVDGGVCGYAITGWGEHQAYLQRVAVAPEARRQGVAVALVLDALDVAQRKRCWQMVVNTQLDNEPAIALYKKLGFSVQPSRLAVMRAPSAAPVETGSASQARAVGGS